MKDAALLVGIWLGIILFAYSAVYLQEDGMTRVTLAGDAEAIDEQNGFRLPLPVGWSHASIDGGAALTAPVSGVEVWALDLAGQTAEDVLAVAWEILDPCSSCERSAILESAPLDDGRDGFVVTLAVDVEGRESHAVVLFQGETARVLLVRLAAGNSLPERVRADLVRIETGFRAIETGTPLVEPSAPAMPEPSAAPATSEPAGAPAA